MFNTKDYQFNVESPDYSSRLISTLSWLHLFHTLQSKDQRSNRPVSSLLCTMGEHLRSMKLDLSTPLSFFTDDIEDLFSFTKPHLDAVLANPRSAIVKEESLVDRDKVTYYDYKTVRYLENKPGNTVREKLANVRKIKTTKKVFTHNVKENQVVLDYLKILLDYFTYKERLLRDYPEIFGSFEENTLILKTRINYVKKALRKIDNEYPEIVVKRNSLPNNALINDKHYGPIWRAYRQIVTGSFAAQEFEKPEQTFCLLSYETLISCLAHAKDISVSDYPHDFGGEGAKAVFSKRHANGIELFTVNCEDSTLELSRESYELANYELRKTETKTIKVELTAEPVEEANPKRGIALQSNGQAAYLDLKGVLEAVRSLLNGLGVEIDDESKRVEYGKAENPYLSITDFSGSLMGEQNTLFPYVDVHGTAGYAQSRDILCLDDEICSAHNLDKGRGSSYLSAISSAIYGDLLIYDVDDCVDEFTAANTRRVIYGAFPNSYPVWRSILACEAFGDNNIRHIVDLVGEQITYSCVGFNALKGRFIHEGQREFRSYSGVPSEKEFLKNYVEQYAQAHQFHLDSHEANALIDSGSISILLCDGEDAAPVYFKLKREEDSLGVICYDGDLFESLCKDYFEDLEILIGDIRLEMGNTLIVLPDYLSSRYFGAWNCIGNKNLYKGATIIAERVKKSEITWLERLPELSLEVVRNGYWDLLKLTESNETENIIGHNNNIAIHDKFVLEPNVLEYRIPLVKSMLGDANKDYFAVLRHPSFPLRHEVEVQLELIYEYGNPNSYTLVFTPTNPNIAPFDKVEAEWEEDRSLDGAKLYEPEIGGVELDETEIPDYINKISMDIARIVRYSNRPQEAKYYDRLSNKMQRLFAVDPSSIAIVQAADPSFTEVLKSQLLQVKEDIKAFIQAKDFNRMKPSVIISHSIQQCIASYSMDKELLFSDYYRDPEYVFGRYLAFFADDYDISQKTYEFIARLPRLRGRGKLAQYEYPNSSIAHDFVARLTAASAVNHKFLLDIYQTHPMCARGIIQTLMDDLDVNAKLGCYSNKFESCYHMKDVIELLYSVLFIRNEPGMEDYLPNGRQTKRIVSSLKAFVRSRLKYGDESRQRPSRDKGYYTERILDIDIKTKLRIHGINKPESLAQVPDHLYVLYLFLVGDEKAGEVTFHGQE